MGTSAVVTLKMPEPERLVEHHFYAESRMDPSGAAIALSSAAIRGAYLNGHDSVEGSVEPVDICPVQFFPIDQLHSNFSN